MHLKILTFTLDKCYMCNLSRWYDYQLQILLISQLGPPKTSLDLPLLLQAVKLERKHKPVIASTGVMCSRTAVEKGFG